MRSETNAETSGLPAWRLGLRLRHNMKARTVWTVPLIVALTLSVPAAAQEFQTKAEYDAYLALYNETDTDRKMVLGEAFLAGYPDSEAVPIAYQILVATAFSSRDWESVLSYARRFETGSLDADADTQSFIYRRAMASAQQTGNSGGIIRYGERILELDRNDLGALLTLPPVILDNLPAFGSGTERGLGRAFELANRARLQAQRAYPAQSDNAQTEAQRSQVFSSIHMSLGTVHFMREAYERAIQEYQTVLSYDTQHPLAYLQIGLSHQFQAARSSQQLVDATSTDPGTPEAISPEAEALQTQVLESTELAMDAFATAVAIGGQAATQARFELETLYRNRHEDSLEGLQEFIDERREGLSESRE